MQEALEEMGTINDIIQVTHNDHLNYYELHTTKKTGEPGHYYFASRALTTDGLELRRKKSRCDGVDSLKKASPTRRQRSGRSMRKPASV